MLSEIETERVCRILVRLAIQIEEIENDQATPTVPTSEEETTIVRMDKHRVTATRKRRNIRPTIDTDAG